MTTLTTFTMFEFIFHLPVVAANITNVLEISFLRNRQQKVASTYEMPFRYLFKR